MMRKKLKIRIFFVTLASIGTVAFAATGIYTAEGYGSDKPGACKSAKDEGQRSLALKTIGKGVSGARISSYSTCDCAENKQSGNATMRWHCTVDVYWSNE